MNTLRDKYPHFENVKSCFSHWIELEVNSAGVGSPSIPERIANIQDILIEDYPQYNWFVQTSLTFGLAAVFIGINLSEDDDSISELPDKLDKLAGVVINDMTENLEPLSTFQVKVTVTFKTVISVEAHTPDEAITKVRKDMDENDGAEYFPYGTDDMDCIDTDIDVEF